MSPRSFSHWHGCWNEKGAALATPPLPSLTLNRTVQLVKKATAFIVAPGPSIKLDDVMGEEVRPGNPGLVATLDAGVARTMRRRRNYHLQRLARHMFKGGYSPSGAPWRVCECKRHPGKSMERNYATGNMVPKDARFVEVWRDKESGVASYRKLAACGSVWTCSVCAGKISAVRMGEVQAASERAGELGLSYCMVTLTVRHGAGDAVKPMLDKMSSALKLMRNNRVTTSVRKAWDFKGLIRALEVTYGEANGWHPHFHELHFFARQLTDADLAEYRASIAKAWLRACETVGLPVPDFDIAVDVRRGSAGYAAKAFAMELVMGVKKQARPGRYSVWELLENNRVSLFREYAEAFHGRRQLLWSPGLKKLLAVADVSDEDAAGDDVEVRGEQADELLLRIPSEDWPRVRGLPGDARVELLELLEDRDWQTADRWLRDIGVTPHWAMLDLRDWRSYRPAA